MRIRWIGGWKHSYCIKVCFYLWKQNGFYIYNVIICSIFTSRWIFFYLHYCLFKINEKKPRIVDFFFFFMLYRNRIEPWHLCTVPPLIYIVVINCGWRMDGESFGRHIYTEVTRTREKAQLLYAGCVHFTVDWLFWNLYDSYISPRSLLSWKKPGNFSFDNMGPSRLKNRL